MPHPDPCGRPWSPDSLPPAERQRIDLLAASLAQAARAGRAAQPLRGKNLAVLCEDGDCPGFGPFCDAATALGARVTRIRPSEALATVRAPSDAMSALLGRLYDAIDCHGLEAEVIAHLARCTGRPVFDALGCQGAAPDCRAANRYTLQALLLSAMG